MGIYGALYAAVSGLDANSNALGIISDNIANANTVGYKDTGTNFSTLVTESGSPDLYSPGGVTSSPLYNISQQGVLQSESSPTDLAISGGGFFVVNSNAAGTGTLSYTRAGDFNIDANGNLVNSAGQFLQGQPLTAAEAAQASTANFNNILTTTQPNLLQTINVSANAGTAQPTANVSLVANLPANDPSTSESMTVPVFDSLGVQHDMTLTFSPVGVPAVPSTVTFTQGGAGSLVGTDTISTTIDGTPYGPTAAIGATTLASVATALNTTFTTDGVGYTASVVAGNLQISDPAGNPITSTVTCSDPTVTFTGGAPANGSVATTVPNEWSVAASLTNAGTSTITIAGGENLIKFNTDGTLNSAGTTFNTASALTIGWDPAVSAGTSPQVLSFNLGTNGTSSGMSQIGTTFNVGQINQDGVAFGNFAGVSVDQNGIVTANYDNGINRPIYIIPISTFNDADKLTPENGNTFAETPDSGLPVLRQAGTGSAGTIAPSSLEDSTVDIATEFSNLIITQRAYEANSKIITTADQMLETLIQAKQ
ncbi:MAG TPA: flagellar hook-basal body complex protein [Stellaceae bacterium]|jgi:flagellar hook protein FlgE